jgi:sRNA-binding carbon storage regulator CsrA
MLVLTRTPGRSIHIGDDIRLKLRDVIRSMALIEIIAPTETCVIEDDIPCRPKSVHGNAAHYVSWQCFGDALRIGEATVLIGQHQGAQCARSAFGRQVRICIDAPRHILILRDELRRTSPRALCAPQFGCPPVGGRPHDRAAAQRHAA